MKKLIFLLTIIFALASCGVDATKYNDSLVDHASASTKRVEKLYDDVENSIKESNYAAITEMVKAATDSLNLDIETAKKMEIASGADAYHASAIAYLESLRDEASSYDVYAKITEQTTDEELDKMDEAVETKTKEVDAKFEVMSAAQVAFAKDKNFQLR